MPREGEFSQTWKCAETSIFHGFPADCGPAAEVAGVVKNLQTNTRLQYSMFPRLPRPELDRCHR
jgi:hypothetical protein